MRQLCILTLCLALLALVSADSRCGTKNVDCMVSRDGADYTGTVNTTQSGFTCQIWEEQTPHRHSIGTHLEMNYCRNPDGEPTVWCYTTDPGKRWELCDVTLCEDCTDEAETDQPATTTATTITTTTSKGDSSCGTKNVDCMVSRDGVDYTGTVNTTQSGFTCQKWEAQTPHQHYIGTDLEMNYCRNPDGEPTVWCYTTDPGKRWELCDVTICEDCSDEAETDQPATTPTTTTHPTTTTTVATTTTKGDCNTVNIQTSTWHNAHTAGFYSGIDQDACFKKCKDFLAARGTFCVGWSYYKPSAWCYIHDIIDESKLESFGGFSFARNERCPSKFPNCKPTVRVDIAHVGEDITTKTTKDLEECYQLCKDFEQDAGVMCEGIMFRESDNRCWILGKVDKCKLNKKDGHLFAKNEPCQTETARSHEKVTCGDFSCLEENHTLRKWSGASEECTAKTRFREFTQAGKDAIVKYHNEFRQRVASGNETTGNQPAAANMRKMVWNDELAMTAQRWSDQCTFGHDPNRRMCDGTYAGQNGAGGINSKTDTWEAINEINYVKMWYDEVKVFDSANINPFKYQGKYGHYSQVVWAESYMVGCGIVSYLKTPDSYWVSAIVMCNYAPGGNFGTDPMYLVGTPCSQCPEGTFCDTEFDALCV